MRLQATPDDAGAHAAYLFSAELKREVRQLLERAAAILETRGLCGDPLVRAVAYIVRSYTLSIHAGDIAGAAGLSRSRLYERFTQAVGFSPGEFVTALRLHHAQRLLAEGLSVKAAAFEVGYRSPAAFGATFRAWLGVAPTGWKARTAGLDARD